MRRMIELAVALVGGAVLGRVFYLLVLRDLFFPGGAP